MDGVFEVVLTIQSMVFAILICGLFVFLIWILVVGELATQLERIEKSVTALQQRRPCNHSGLEKEIKLLRETLPQSVQSPIRFPR